MADLESFRRDARAWLEANCPAEMRQPVVSENDACWGGRRFKFQSEAQLRAQIARFEIDEAAFRMLMQATGDRARRGAGNPAMSSALKYYGAELNKRRWELMISAAGADGLEWEGERSREGGVARTWLRSKGNSIEGGTSEIQLNVVAKRILGLPGA